MYILCLLWIKKHLADIYYTTYCQVQKLTKEITILREHTQQHIQTLPNGYGKSGDVQNSPIRNPTRPQSMFEPRDQQRLSQKVSIYLYCDLT